MLKHVPESPYFKKQNNIPLYEHVTFCVSVICTWTLRLLPPLDFMNPAAANVCTNTSWRHCFQLFVLIVAVTLSMR